MADDHPRDHALAMAGASHLARMGHIKPAIRDRIHAKSRAALKKRQATPPATFGSLAPPMPDTDRDTM